MPGFGGKSSRNLGSRVPKDIDGGVTKSSIIEENRQFPQSGLTCARQDDVAVRIVDLKALEGDSHEVSTQTDDVPDSEDNEDAIVPPKHEIVDRADQFPLIVHYRFQSE
jgi:hypothetical protein